MNAASAFQLQLYVGLGRATAKKIDDARNQKPFADADDFQMP